MTNAEARFIKSHIRKVYACLAVTCHLHFWQNDRDFFTCYCGNTGGGTDTEIRVSTESRPWRRKFSRRSSRDSNPRPFNHESGALTTELSPPPLKGGNHHLPLSSPHFLNSIMSTRRSVSPKQFEVEKKKKRKKKKSPTRFCC